MARHENNKNEDREGFEESPYLRRQRSIEVKRKQLEPSKLRVFFRIFFLILGLGVVAAAVNRCYDFVTTAPQFNLTIHEVSGLRHLSETVVMEQLAPLLGQNIFRANYDERIRALKQIPWVQSVSFQRFWPNRVSVLITERVPVGFALINGTVTLIDGEGVALSTVGDTQPHFDFPVMRGLVSENTTDDHKINQVRIQRYMQLLKALDSEQGEYSRDLSEVDVSDPEDVRVLLIEDPVLIHLGRENFLARFKLYLANIKKLKQDFPDIDSADLRYKDQIIIKRHESGKSQESK